MPSIKTIQDMSFNLFFGAVDMLSLDRTIAKKRKACGLEGGNVARTESKVGEWIRTSCSVAEDFSPGDPPLIPLIHVDTQISGKGGRA